MKNSLKYLTLAISVFALVFTACEKDENIDDSTSDFQEDIIINMNNLENRTLVTDPEMLEAIAALDIDAGIVSRGDFHLPDGTIEERIYIGSDITFTFEELNALIEGCEGCRQYSTYNLVEGSYLTIDILGYTGGSQALTSKARTALQYAVDNYNNLNTTLQFNLTFGTNHQAADMVVYDNSVNNPGGTGGVAGFPNSSGQPHKYIQIYGIEQFSTNVNEHVITHEIGHSVGFRHSDWFDRASCGSYNNEGQGSNGAVHIPGTPTGTDATSIMQACFSTSADGEFNGNDITALEYLYAQSSSGPCDGVPAWNSGTSYSPGDRVTYQGNLYERTSSGWDYLGPC